MNIKGLTTRTVSGVIYIAIIICCLLCGSAGVMVLGVLLSSLAMLEFDHITEKGNRNSLILDILDILGAITLSLGGLGYPLLIWIILMLIRMTAEIYLGKNNPLRDVGLSMMGQIYIGIPMLLMYQIYALTGSGMPILALFIMIWLNDTGAFLIGCNFGKHRLFERVSPKKSWEGFFGGMGFTIVASVLFGLFCPDFFALPISLPLWITLGILTVICATYGDLFESLIKRSLNIKDSGNIIPGHGGILDRIDSLLFVLPAAYVFLMLIMK